MLDSASELDGRQAPGLVRRVAGLDPGSWQPASESCAEAVIEEIADYCGRRCPWVERCYAEACRLWRFEHTAKAFLERKGFPGVVIGPCRRA